jgi:superfamily II DNA or RNA helicase
MASLRERNNVASKKSYEKSLEKQHATDYEYEIVREHRTRPNTEAWHWSNVPEDYLYQAGYITNYNKHRQERLMNKKEATPGINRLRDFGLDGLARTKISENDYVYDALQAKYYMSRNVTAGDIGSFTAIQILLNLKDKRSNGYLYSTAKLQADLAGILAHPEYPIKYINQKWTHLDKRHSIDTPSKIQECDLPLRPYQKDAIDKLKDEYGINALHIPCRMGKTLITGHILQHNKPGLIVAIAPLRISVKNLQDRLTCFLSDYSSILVDSDSDGTTNPDEIVRFLEGTNKKIIYSTYDSFIDILSPIFINTEKDDEDEEGNEETLFDNAFILADEVHNAIEKHCDFINQFHQGLVMSATFPENLSLDINKTVYIPFSYGINEGYLTDYSIWLPHLTRKADGNTQVDVEIPIEFKDYSSDLTAKALYLAVVMLKTGSRRCIAYLSDIEECDTFRKIVAMVFEEYHGLDVWTGKVDSTIGYKKREELLNEFQSGSDDVYHIMTSVRILDEAVDIPRCDSEFLASVGENSSIIRFMQRCQRGSTKDPSNPNKHNNIILWADGWEKCTDALELLREADPEFHKKIRIVNTSYNKQGNKEQETILSSKVIEFCEWDTVRCIDSWEKKRQDWIQFYKDNNKNPSKHSNNLKEKQLGQWVGQQRNNYKKHNIKWMTVERIRLLEEETPGWRWEKLNSWEEKRQNFIKFYDIYNRDPLKSVDNFDEKTLAQWQFIQRRNYKKKYICMTSEIIRLLEEETPGWRWEKPDRWEEQRQELIIFYKKNKRNPIQSSYNIKEKQLARWQQTQRVNYKKKSSRMTFERVRLLEENTTGWRWEEINTWEEKRQELIQFYIKNRTTPSQSSNDLKEKQLGSWQQHQRKDYKNKEKRMTSEKVRLLEEISGWRWEEPDTWEEQRRKWIGFYSNNKQYPSMSSKKIEEKQLGQWQSDQRKHYKKKDNCMTSERVRLLEEETPVWRWEEPDTWEEQRHEWIKFYQENKRYPLQSSNNIKEKQLARWQQTQRINYNKKEKRLTIQRIKLLDKETPGWNWSKSKILI